MIMENKKKKKQARSDKHIYARIVVLHIFVLEPHTKPIQTHTMASLVSFTDSSYEDGNPLHAWGSQNPTEACGHDELSLPAIFIPKGFLVKLV